MKHLRFAALTALALTAALALAAHATETPKAAAAAGAKAGEKAATNLAATDKAVLAIDAQITAANVNKTAPDWKETLPAPKKVAFDAAKKYYIRMATSEGTVLIRLMPDVAPMHATNMIYLSRLGFYDGIKFHRVIKGFMAQGGCPKGTGTGGPGYAFEGEFSPTVKHDKPGILSMANAGPGTDGSQFFLTFKATPWLDGKHTVFGEVVEGKDVLTKLEANGSQGGAPTKPMNIDKCTVEVR